MRNHLCALITGILLMSSTVPFAHQRRPQLKTIPDSINFIWKDITQDFTALAEAMPEDKWSFRPTQGEFKDVRTFGEQVKHVACANVGQTDGRRKTARPLRHGGPNPAKTKTEILSYLHDSFTMINKVIEETNTENLMHPNVGAYWGSNRHSALTATVWHVSDHYGQLVEYLRMNGIVPPASRKQAARRIAGDNT